MSLVRTLSFDDLDYAQQLQAIRHRLHHEGLVAAGEGALDVPSIVRKIVEEVRVGGDGAAARLASELDRAQLTAATLRVEPEAIAEAHRNADPSFLALIRRAVANIKAYQEHILLKAPTPLVNQGRKLGLRYTPLDRVAVYVPGGKALYPSTVLMTAVPAMVAGVKEIVMLTPATAGEINPLALALAFELGIDEVFRLGGAVAIAAAAFGTESLRRVDKIVGPGNAFVAEAKRQLFGRVGIDSIAGPSEVLIVADDSANPRWTAADMLAQAEHDPGSALLVTPSQALASAVQQELAEQLGQLARATATRNAIEKYSAIIVTRDLEEACAIANDFATEHLQIVTADNDGCLAKIRHAGAIFVGPYAPVPLGDYFAGPSHVLPTGGTAKFFGPLSCNDFLKASSVIEYAAADLRADGPHVCDFAEREGLTAHARSVSIRLE